MKPESGNPNPGKANRPLPLERREEATDSQHLAAPPSSGPVSVTDATTTYSANSAIRSPFHLLHDISSDIWNRAELVWQLFIRNIRGLYRQTLLGLFWAFFPPVAITAIGVFHAVHIDWTDGLSDFGSHPRRANDG